MSERVAQPEVQAPVESVVGEAVEIEDAAIARSEIELEGEVSVDEVFQTENGVRAAFGVVAAPLRPVFVEIAEEIVPGVADAAAHPDKSVQVAREPALVHEVRGEFRRPQMGAIDIAVLCAEVELDGEMVAREDLVRHGLRGAERHADTVFVRSLRVCLKGCARENREKQDNNAVFSHHNLVFNCLNFKQLHVLCQLLNARQK